MKIEGYHIIDCIEDKPGNTTYIASKKNQQFVLKAYREPKLAYHNFNISNALQCQYILPYSNIFEAGGKTILVQQFAHGESLHDFMEKRQKKQGFYGIHNTNDTRNIHQNHDDQFIQATLAIVKNILNGLKYIHEKGVVYNHLCLKNLFNGSDGQLYFFDFSIAIDKKEQNRCEIKGNDWYNTPALSHFDNILYMAPELSGKVNSSIDYQSDYYSLGIMLYKLFTGCFPFETDDISELVSLHMAGKPIHPSLINAAIPQNLARIILKLLEKNKSDRYASLEGIMFDLTHFESDTFILAFHDFDDHFKISGKVYGRERELNILQQNIDDVKDGGKNLTIIAGYSGVGKSTLITELYNTRKEDNIHFITGKFQQYKKNIPYFAFLEAFNELFDRILFSEEKTLIEFKSAFSDTIGDQGEILTSIFPKLEMIVGPQQPVEKQIGVEAENRFKYVFLKLIEIVATHEKALILFIDDLQWTDLVSLNVLKALINSENRYVMIVLAYRDNEVDRHHPFHQFITELKLRPTNGLSSDCIYSPDTSSLSSHCTLIKLTDLKPVDVEHIVKDSLGREDTKLSRIIYSRTHGNSFFVHQFLKKLVDQSLLHIDRVTGIWQVDSRGVEELKVSDNVVEFMQTRLHKFNADVLYILKIIGATGHNVPLNILSVISGLTVEMTEHLLKRPLEDGLLIKRQNRIFFVHDKIQQACYQLNDQKELPKLHFEIANILIKHALTNTLEELFSVTAHLSKGFSYITANLKNRQCKNKDTINLITYIDLYYQAALKSKEIAAYSEELEFIGKAMELLDNYFYENDIVSINNFSQEDIRFRCAREYHIALHLNGFYEEADLFFKKEILTCPDIFAIKDNCICKVSQDSMLGKYKDASEFGISILKQRGLKIHLTPTHEELVQDLRQVYKGFEQKNIQTIFDLKKIPKKNHEEMEFITELIQAIIPGSFFFNPMLSCLLIFLTLKLATRNGTYSAMGYPLSVAATPFIMIENNYKTGYDYGQFAMQIAGNNKRALGNSKHLFILFSYHWQKPIKDNHSLEIASEAFHLLIQGGDIQMAGFIFFNTTLYLLERGEHLSTVLEDLNKGLDYATKTHNYHALGPYSIFRQFILTMQQAKETKIYGFCQDGFDEAQYIKSNKQSMMAQCYLYIYKTQLLFMFKKYDEAYEVARLAQATHSYITGFISVSVYYFYMALCLCKKLPDDAALLPELQSHIDQLNVWGIDARENFLHKYYLVEAEKHHALGDLSGSIRFFGLAIKEANRNQFTHDIAMTYELFSDFWFDQDNQELGEIYLKKAYGFYEKWGASSKLIAIKASHQDLFFSDKDYNLDLLCVIHAQNIMSRETRFDQLLKEMMKILLEVSGAEKAFLILQNQATTDKDSSDREITSTINKNFNSHKSMSKEH